MQAAYGYSGLTKNSIHTILDPPHNAWKRHVSVFSPDTNTLRTLSLLVAFPKTPMMLTGLTGLAALPVETQKRDSGDTPSAGPSGAWS